MLEFFSPLTLFLPNSSYFFAIWIQFHNISTLFLLENYLYSLGIVLLFLFILLTVFRFLFFFIFPIETYLSISTFFFHRCFSLHFLSYYSSIASLLKVCLPFILLFDTPSFSTFFLSFFSIRFFLLSIVILVRINKCLLSRRQKSWHRKKGLEGL